MIEYALFIAGAGVLALVLMSGLLARQPAQAPAPNRIRKIN